MVSGAAAAEIGFRWPVGCGVGHLKWILSPNHRGKQSSLNRTVFGVMGLLRPPEGWLPLGFHPARSKIVRSLIVRCDAMAVPLGVIVVSRTV